MSDIYETLIKNPYPIDPFNEKDPSHEQYKSIFENLQGGIIKNYGRSYSLYIFAQFHDGKVNDVKHWIQHTIASNVTSTWKQFCDTKFFKEETKRRQQTLDSSYYGELCANFFLTYAGYKTLGFDPANLKGGEAKKDDFLNDSSFKSGMRRDWEDNYRLKKSSNDYWYNPPECWDIGGRENDQSGNVPSEYEEDHVYAHDVHALILLAHADLEELKEAASTIIANCETFGKVIACETGYVLKNGNTSIGPFGFADNISQPLFLKQDHDEYCNSQDIEKWDPKASLNLVLVKDPFACEPYSYGSYCVFQKLETNYKCFEDKVRELAEALECDRERAASLVIGRFKDGTPIALSDQPNQNSFNYADDHDGEKCPLHAHIRKVNPRQDSKDEATNEGRRTKNRIFRAGITYFDVPKPLETSNMSEICLNKLNYLKGISTKSLKNNIENISGLLFVCFQSSIQLQFSTQQANWADNRKFPRDEEQGKSIYLDPLIGHPATKEIQQLPIREEWQKWQKQGSSDEKVSYGFYGCIKVRGGEFFFAPSISFLKNLS
jgi:Dyp-type peroxidase family